MKILMLNYEFPPLGGGASPVSYELAKRYVDLGHKVSVVTMGYKGLAEHEFIDGIEVYRVKSWRRKKEICHPWEQLSYLISAKKFLQTHLQKQKYDINHTHFLIPTGTLAKWAKKRFNLKYIVTSHGSDVPGFNNDRFKLLHKFTGPLLKSVAKHADKIVTPSKYLESLILKNISPNLKSKIIHIPNGIEINKFRPQKKEKYILSTGRLLARKGFKYLVEAVSDLDTDYELHIAGDGPLMEELKEMSKDSKTNIIFHGWIDNQSKKYKDLLEKASIYSLVSSNENASIALLEGMSAGCAVITANSSGCAETIGDAGITIEVKDTDKLNKAILSLIQNPQKLEELQSKAAKKVENQYNWDIVIGKYTELLYKLTNQHAKTQ